MTTSREQALGEGNCARATEHGKEACECMGKRRVCSTLSERLTLLGCILTKSARLRTETSYKTGSVRRVSQSSQMPLERNYRLSIDQVKGELVQRRLMLLSEETCLTPRSKSSRRLKARSTPAHSLLLLEALATRSHAPPATDCLGVPRRQAIRHGKSRKGPWRMAKTIASDVGMTNVC
jgi:hypothetical protein